ncbi:MAG TPA: hypothetical protein VMS17_02675 [Gemmataceae bacterium]|nr:hypothetical protein [Gemmataceae bacterium]
MPDLLPLRIASLIVVAWWLVQAVLLFAVATFVFDVIHAVLHVFAGSRFRLLRWLASLHQSHHDFFDTDLRFHDDQIRSNLIKHVVPEYLTQMSVSAAGLLVFDVAPVVLVMGLLTVLFIGMLWLRGKDANHVAFETLPAPRGGLWVDNAYHALHHVYPPTYISSYFRVFDLLFGTGCRLRGRRVALTGASGAFGEPMRKLLTAAGARVTPLTFGRDYSYDDYSRLDDVLQETDILVLCHGAKGEQAMQANCDSFVAIIERFRSLTRERRFPVEVWAVGSEIEFHPTFGVAALRPYLESKRAFARHARGYWRDRTFVYRHIVPAAFRSRMGPGLMSGQTAARTALFFIRRGFRYVPVTYTGIALLNYFKFLLLPGPPRLVERRPAPAAAPSAEECARS